MIELQTYTCQICELNTISIPCGSEEVWRIEQIGWTAFYQGVPPELAVLCPDCKKTASLHRAMLEKVIARAKEFEQRLNTESRHWTGYHARTLMANAAGVAMFRAQLECAAGTPPEVVDDND